MPGKLTTPQTGSSPVHGPLYADLTLGSLGSTRASILLFLSTVQPETSVNVRESMVMTGTSMSKSAHIYLYLTCSRHHSVPCIVRKGTKSCAYSYRIR